MNIATAASVVSKSQYAVLKNVSPGRVTQWITEGKIESDALVGEGRAAKIKVAVADQQLRRKLDLSQRLGNGLATRFPDAPAAAAVPVAVAETPAAAPSLIDAIDEAFKREKLEGVRRENRKRAEEEEARAGRYMETQDARSQMSKIASQVLSIFEGGLPEIAGSLAAKFNVSQRDMLHALRAEVRNVRSRAAASLRREIAQSTMLVEVDVDDEADEISQ